MDAGTLSIQKMFGYERRLVVPLSSGRTFWTRDQWEPLWDDTGSVADRLVGEQGPRPALPRCDRPRPSRRTPPGTCRTV